MTILALFMFILMMVAGGIALDTMRSERERVALQSALDRGALAATNLEQTRPPETVMRDYLRAAGIDDDDVTIDVVDAGGAKSGHGRRDDAHAEPVHGPARRARAAPADPHRPPWRSAPSSSSRS